MPSTSEQRRASSDAGPRLREAGRRKTASRRRSSILPVLQIVPIALLVGMVDGAGFLLTGVFVSFMSGNTTNAAVSLAGSDQLKGLILLSTILVFVLGNFFGELAALASGRRATAVVLACAAVFLLLAAGRGDHDPEYLSLASLVFSMGAVNASIGKVGGVRVGLTYVTGALSKIAIGLARVVAGKQDADLALNIQYLPCIGVFAGASISSLLHSYEPELLLWVPAVFAICLTFIAAFVPSERGKTTEDGNAHN